MLRQHSVMTLDEWEKEIYIIVAIFQAELVNLNEMVHLFTPDLVNFRSTGTFFLNRIELNRTKLN